MKKITLKKYLELKESERRAVDLFIGSVKPVVNIAIKGRFSWRGIAPKTSDLWKLNYGDMLELKELATTPATFETIEKIIKLIYGLETVENVSVVHLFNCTSWIFEQLTEIVEIENNELKNSVDQKLIDAGIEELNRFGYMPTVDKLAGGDISEYSKVLSWPYDKVFMKLCYENTLSNINKKLNENVGR